METPISLNVLDNVQIAAPCTANWEEMAGDDRTRHCVHCDQNVYNLSAMTSMEADALIESAEGRMCIRLYRRADGTVITQDCPVGLRAVRQRVVRSIRNVAATTVALFAGMIGLGSRPATAQQNTMMGGMVRPALQLSDDSPHADTVTRKHRTVKHRTVHGDSVKHEPMRVMGEMVLRRDADDVPAADTTSNNAAPVDAIPVDVSIIDKSPVEPVSISPLLSNVGIIDTIVAETIPDVAIPVDAIQGTEIQINALSMNNAGLIIPIIDITPIAIDMAPPTSPANQIIVPQNVTTGASPDYPTIK